MPAMAFGFELCHLILSEIHIVMQMETHNWQTRFTSDICWQSFRYHVCVMDGFSSVPRRDKSRRQVNQFLSRVPLGIRRSVERNFGAVFLGVLQCAHLPMRYGNLVFEV